MATARPLQKLFPTTTTNSSSSSREKISLPSNKPRQPYVTNTYTYADDDDDYDDDDDDIYGVVCYPQFRSNHNNRPGACSSNLPQQPCTKTTTTTKIYPPIPPIHRKMEAPPGGSAAPPLPRRAPPPVPFKPHHLRAKYNASMAPPLPPRVVNRDAIIQRKQLDEEYFENIRRIVDANAASRSVKIPGTESRPYWTIEDSRDVTSSSSHDISQPATSSPRDPCRNEFIRSLTQLKHTPWYWSDMSWEDAELMLSVQPGVEGLFLVRDSQDPHHILTLTVRSFEQTIHHIRIEYNDGKFHLYEPTGNISEGAVGYCRHSNVIKFIELAVEQSRSGTFIYFVKPKIMGQAPIQIRLLTPVSRFAHVKSLQHNCRLMIRDRVAKYQLQHLPIPYHLIKYLHKSPYFDPKEDLPIHLQPSTKKQQQ